MSNIYKKGENKKQQMFFDEYVSEDNQVRAIEDYVEILDMVELGFTKSALNSSDGQPAYHPKLLLKIYIYGYLNRIRSSRKLETEIKRNIEMMWLCAGLNPSYKTIADFRKENSKPLKNIFILKYEARKGVFFHSLLVGVHNYRNIWIPIKGIPTKNNIKFLNSFTLKQEELKATFPRFARCLIVKIISLQMMIK